MRGDKLGSVYQAIRPSHLNGISFGRGSESDTVTVLRGSIHRFELDDQNLQTETAEYISKSSPFSLVYLNVLGEEIVAVGAIVKHNLVEGGRAQLQHLAVVITAVLIFTYHPLAHCELLHRSLVALWSTRK